MSYVLSDKQKCTLASNIKLQNKYEIEIFVPEL